jgi:hypothetical protein
MSTLDEILGVLSQLEGGEPGGIEAATSSGGREIRVATDGGSFAYRRKVQHLDQLLARAERDGTLETIFSPGYPPVRIDVAADGERAVVLVEDPDAGVTVDGEGVTVTSKGRERHVSLPFTPTGTDRKSVSGMTTVLVD